VTTLVAVVCLPNAGLAWLTVAVARWRIARPRMPGFPWTACPSADPDWQAWPRPGDCPTPGEPRLRDYGPGGPSPQRPGFPWRSHSPTLARNGPAQSRQFIPRSPKGAREMTALANTARWLVSSAPTAAPDRARHHNAQREASLVRAHRADAGMATLDSPALTRSPRA